MSISIKAKLISAVVMFLFAQCYYDKEPILYQEKHSCSAPTNPSFATDVLPLLNSRCNTCHSGNTPSGGIKLDTFTEVSKYATSGSLMGSINQTSGYSPMPKGMGKMSACEINKIQNWITSGALNN